MTRGSRRQGPSWADLFLAAQLAVSRHWGLTFKWLCGCSGFWAFTFVVAQLAVHTGFGVLGRFWAFTCVVAQLASARMDLNKQ